MSEFGTVTTEELVDIRSVSVNRDLPKEERIADFIRQIKNPYLFRCGKYTVRASFSENGQTLEECIKGLISVEPLIVLIFSFVIFFLSAIYF